VVDRFVQPRIGVNLIFRGFEIGRAMRTMWTEIRDRVLTIPEMTTKAIGKIPRRHICWAISFILVSMGFTSCAPEPFLNGPPVQSGNGDLIGPSQYNQFSQEFEAPWPFGRP
jgi:hypothetical protein